jgi:hypothetical protein
MNASIAKISYTSYRVDSYGIVAVVCIFSLVSFMYFYCRRNEEERTNNISDIYHSSQAHQ